MQVTEVQAEGLKREFKVVVAGSQIKSRVDERLAGIGATAKLPGFRPGKVPQAILRKRFLPSVMGEVLEQTIGETWRQALSERGLRPALQPKIEVTDFSESADLVYTLGVELLPEVPTVDFGKIALERVKADVGEPEIERALDTLAQRARATTPLAEPRPSRGGDVLVIDFVGRVDGVAFPGGSAEGHHLELGSGAFIPGFEDQLVGVEAGAETVVKLSFPEDYPNKELAAKPAEFTVTVKEIREPAPAVIDEAFAKAQGFETLEKMRQMVREQIERDFTRVSRGRLKRGLLDALAETVKFDVPPGMIEAEYQGIVQQVKNSAAENGGEAPPEVPPVAKEPTESEQQEYRQLAERRVRLGLLLSDIGRLNNLTVSEEEMRRAIAQQAMRFPGMERRVIEHFQGNQEAQAELRAPLLEDKIVDYILELAQVGERTVTPEELFKSEEADTAQATA